MLGILGNRQHAMAQYGAVGRDDMLHLPEPSELAEAAFGAERAAELLAEGEATAVNDMVAALATSPPPHSPLSAG